MKNGYLIRASLAAAVVSMGILATVNSAQALVKVRTYSITAYTGFSIYAAKELGLFKKHGIDTDPKWFPSGAPIMQAAAAGAWDMTFLGAPPMTLGGPKLGLKTVGMVAEEAGMHQLIGRPDFVAKVKKNHQALRGAKIFVTMLSTGHYMTEACLQKFGLTTTDVKIIPSEQQATLSAFTAGQGDLAQVWSPQSTALKNRGNVVLCDANETKLSMPAVWVVHPKFAANPKNRKTIINWLKAQLDAVNWILADRKRTFDLYKKYDKYRGFNFSDKLLQGEVDLVMSTYMGLTDQLKMLSKGPDGIKPITKSFEEIAKFFIRQGRLKSVPDYSKVVDASYLKAIASGE
jgi:ABC-type nitrate/sulfonate/bicarbonate transport system substrate-binding protein